MRATNRRPRGERLLDAIGALTKGEGKRTFHVREIRELLGLRAGDWVNYAPILKGMLEDPGSAPRPRREWRGLLRHGSRGEYTLTPAGERLIRSASAQTQVAQRWCQGERDNEAGAHLPPHGEVEEPPASRLHAETRALLEREGDTHPTKAPAP
jgi:hypothetical protein